MYRCTRCANMAVFLVLQIFARTLVGLIVSQLTFIGMFGLKQTVWPTILLVPLPLLSIAFYYRCVEEFENVSHVRHVPAVMTI
jgi:hypothetical protein